MSSLTSGSRSCSRRSPCGPMSRPRSSAPRATAATTAGASGPIGQGYPAGLARSCLRLRHRRRHPAPRPPASAPAPHPRRCSCPDRPAHRIRPHRRASRRRPPTGVGDDRLPNPRRRLPAAPAVRRRPARPRPPVLIGGRDDDDHQGRQRAGRAAAVRATLTWPAGPGVPDIDGSALLVRETGKVASDDDFVFYNQPAAPERRRTARGQGGHRRHRRGGPGGAAGRSRPGRARRLRRRWHVRPGTRPAARDQRPRPGAPLAEFAIDAGQETAMVCGELYRRNGQWKFRAVGQGYASGLAGLATDYGISVGDDPRRAAAPPAAGRAAAAPAGASRRRRRPAPSRRRRRRAPSRRHRRGHRPPPFPAAARARRRRRRPRQPARTPAPARQLDKGRVNLVKGARVSLVKTGAPPLARVTMGLGLGPGPRAAQHRPGRLGHRLRRDRPQARDRLVHATQASSAGRCGTAATTSPGAGTATTNRSTSTSRACRRTSPRSSSPSPRSGGRSSPRSPMPSAGSSTTRRGAGTGALRPAATPSRPAAWSWRCCAASGPGAGGRCARSASSTTRRR